MNLPVGYIVQDNCYIFLNDTIYLLNMQIYTALQR